jgi:glycyl-tRNA synthetase
LLRLREFYQAEIEIFCNPEKLDEVPMYDELKATKLNIQEDNSSHEISAQEALEKGLLPNRLIAYYLALLSQFYSKTGIDMKRTRFRKLSEDDKAFYSTVAFDFEVETSLGWLELVACNYRSDYDLSGHMATSKENLEVVDPSTQAKVLPHVFELSMGIDRSLYAILEHSYYEDYKHDDRIVLRLKPYLAPITVGVLPLMNKDGIGVKGREIYAAIRKDFDAYSDESGSIGRRYRRLEEIGVPFALTIDKTTMVDETVTIRNRDTMEQERIKISEIQGVLGKAINLYE